MESRLDKAMAKAFDHPVLAARRDRHMEELADRLAELTEQIRRHSEFVPPSLPADSLPTLRSMIDGLEARAPFLATTHEERVVAAAIRCLVRSIEVKRLSSDILEARIVYDLSTLVGSETKETLVAKTLQFDREAEAANSRALTRRRAFDVVASDAFVVNDEAYARLAAFPGFRALFGDRPEAEQRAVLRAVLLKSAESVPMAALKEAMTDIPPDSWNRLHHFRKGNDVAPMVAAMLELYPGRFFKYEALKSRDEKTHYNWHVATKLRRTRHPFLELDICRPGQPNIAIRPEHWDVVEVSGIVSTQFFGSPRFGKASSDQFRRALDGLAHALRDGVSVAEAAKHVGLPTNKLSMMCNHLHETGRLEEIAQILRDLSRQERRGRDDAAVRGARRPQRRK